MLSPTRSFPPKRTSRRRTCGQPHADLHIEQKRRRVLSHPSTQQKKSTTHTDPGKQRGVVRWGGFGFKACTHLLDRALAVAVVIRLVARAQGYDLSHGLLLAPPSLCVCCWIASTPELYILWVWKRSKNMEFYFIFMASFLGLDSFPPPKPLVGVQLFEGRGGS